MALASRLAGPDNAVPSLLGSDSWLSKKKQKKDRELVPARLGRGAGSVLALVRQTQAGGPGALPRKNFELYSCSTTQVLILSVQCRQHLSW